MSGKPANRKKSMAEAKIAREKAEREVLAECSKYTYSDMLMLRPPPNAIEASVPRPRRAHVPGGLPLWDKAPLNAKLPLMAGPDGPLVFTRGKLGEKLWKSLKGVQFTLSDPHNHEVKFFYDPEHDGHLKAWLKQPHTLQLLQSKGLATEDLRAICGVHQYNNYRQFLSKQYSDALRREAERREDLAMEKANVSKAIASAEKEAAKFKKMEDSMAARGRNMNRLQELEMERLLRCKKRLQRVLDRAARAEQRREEEVLQRKERMDAFDRRIRSRIAAAKTIERQNKIKAMKTRHKQDVEMKKLFEKRAKQRELENKQKAEARWKRKVEEQMKRIAKEKFLHEKRKMAMEQERQQYMAAMEKEWARMEDELNQRKCRSELDKIKQSQRQKSMKQIMRSVSEAYASHKSVEFLSQDQETMATLLERIQQALREIRYDLEPYIVIAHAKSRLEKQENVPLPVCGAIKYLLEQTIVEYTAGQLQRTMAQFANKVLSTIDELKSNPTAADRRSVSMKKSRSSTSAFIRSQSISSTPKTARISAAELVIPIRKTQAELNVSPDELRSIKERPPTPMPSISTFTEVLFKEPEMDEFYEVPTTNFPFIEQAKLIKEITEVSNRIFHMIPTRVRSVIESRSYDRISNDSATSMDLPENKPVARLCSVVLFEEAVKEQILTQIVDRIILGFMQDINLTPSYLRLRIKQKLEMMKDPLN